VTPNDDAYHYEATTLSVFWPWVEHEKLLARWPHLATEVGATWDEHRQRHERHCAYVTRAGLGVNQTSGSVADLEAFLRDKRVRKPSATSADYSLLVRLGTQVQAMLPPARPGHSRLTGSA